MKEITLTTGRTVRIEALTLRQVKTMTELTEAGKAMESMTTACVNGINRAAGSDVMDIDQFMEGFTVPEANELYLEIMNISGLKLGEAQASA